MSPDRKLPKNRVFALISGLELPRKNPDPAKPHFP